MIDYEDGTLGGDLRLFGGNPEDGLSGWGSWIVDFSDPDVDLYDLHVTGWVSGKTESQVYGDPVNLNLQVERDWAKEPLELRFAVEQEDETVYLLIDGQYLPGVFVFGTELALTAHPHPSFEDLASHAFSPLEDPAFYLYSVAWVNARGITNGTGNGSTFSPNEPCLREQIMTFLWRMMGSPASSDAAAGKKPYYKETVLWAEERQILALLHVISNLDLPGKVCSRADMVNILAQSSWDYEPFWLNPTP